jgi:Tol biopolymer transport system component
VVRKGDFGYGLAISPDGCKLAYVVPGRIITKKTPQGEVARTTKSALVIAAADGSGKPERVFRAYYIDHADLAWSPSGDRIAIAAEESLRVYDATTGATQAVGLGETYYVGSPTWAPDGTEIAFAGDPFNGAKSQDVRPDIYVIPATGGVAQPLAVTPQYSESSLSWSPDGRSIAFVDLNAPTEDIHGTHEAYRRGVFLYSVQTNTLTGLAKRTGLHPTWLPDSSAVVYAKNLGYTSGNAGEPVRKIVAVSLAGEAARTILGPRATLRDPDWAREGSLPAP